MLFTLIALKNLEDNIWHSRISTLEQKRFLFAPKWHLVICKWRQSEHYLKPDYTSVIFVNHRAIIDETCLNILSQLLPAKHRVYGSPSQ